MSERPASDRKVRIGKIVGCHGIRGDVKIRTNSDDPTWADTLNQVYLKAKDGREQTLKIAGAKLNGPQVLLRFEGKPDRTAVEPLVGMEVYALYSDLPEPDEGEYWADDIIGLAVVDAQNGRARGTVKDLLSSGGSDFLEIQLESSSETMVVPFIDRFFPTVDLKVGTITVDLLSDFLGEDSEPVTSDRLEE